MSVEIDLEPFSLPLHEPLQTAETTISERSGIAVRLRTADGIGVGEATPLDGWTEEYATCLAALEDIAGTVVAHPGRLPLPEHPAARHAIHLAVSDLVSRIGGMCLADYLGGKEYPQHVPVNATIGNVPVDQSVRAARSAIDRGFSVVKCKAGGRPLAEERERIAAIRDALGPDPSLRLDANRAWTPGEALHLWGAIEDASVTYVEEPLRNPTPNTIANLARSSVGIALDETIVRASVRLDEWIPHIDAVVLKPMALGGIDRALDLGMWATRNGLRPVVSSTVDGVIGRTASIHLAVLLPDLAAAGLATGTSLDGDLAADPAPVRDGRVRVPGTPGIGTLGPWEAQSA